MRSTKRYYAKSHHDPFLKMRDDPDTRVARDKRNPRDVAIGYYAHHHGQGHLTRALTIASRLPCPMTLFSSIDSPADMPPSVTAYTLPPDTEARLHTGRHAESDAASDKLPSTPLDAVNAPLKTLSGALPGAFHYAPLAMPGIARRMATMVNWFRDAWPCLLVVDVSVEVALLARLCSVPTVYVRQRGNRSDPPHALAYASATALLAPYPESFVDRPVLNEWMDKTVFTGFISRYAPYPSSDNPQSEFQAEYQAQSRPPLESKHVCVLVGYGGTVITATSLSEAARASPQWQWTVVGPVSRPSAETASPIPDNIRFLGVVNDPVRWLLSADVVIGSAGDSVVAEVAALRKRFICFAEPRPFDEQMATAQSLEHNGLAIYCRQWPGTILWPVLLGRALNLDPTRWDQFMQADGAAKAANAILSAAAQVYGTQSGRTTC